MACPDHTAPTFGCDRCARPDPIATAEAALEEARRTALEAEADARDLSRQHEQAIDLATSILRRKLTAELYVGACIDAVESAMVALNDARANARRAQEAAA